MTRLPSTHRMRRREITGNIRFITFSCHQRFALLGSAPIRDVFVDSLRRSRSRYKYELFAWVVMPEHIHLLIRPTETSLVPILRFIKLSSSQRVLSRWKALNAPVLRTITLDDGTPRFWQKGGGFDRNVRHMSEFCREVRYIHNNPVTRGLVDKPETWRWSSVHWWMQPRECDLMCDSPPGGPGSWGNWKGFV